MSGRFVSRDYASAVVDLLSSSKQKLFGANEEAHSRWSWEMASVANEFGIVTIRFLNEGREREGVRSFGASLSVASRA